MGPVAASRHGLSHIESVRVATDDRQQPTTKYTSCFVGDTPVILRIIRRNAALCESRKTLFMAPENKLIAFVTWQVNSNSK